MRKDDFERLYSTHAEALFRFLTLRTGDRSVAEDLSAETFERVFRAKWRFDRRKASEKAWIYSIALNCLRDLARRRAVEERALEQLVTEPPSDPLPAVEDRDEVARALATLSDAEREAIALRYGADLTLPEIAKVARLPLTTVEGRVYGALRKLREDLE